MSSSEAQSYFSVDPQTFDSGDAVLAWRKFGRGPALLLVHGFPLHGFTWRLVPLHNPQGQTPLLELKLSLSDRFGVQFSRRHRTTAPGRTYL